MIMNILNYVVRIAIIIVGILLLSGIVMPPNTDATMVKVMGGILILWGIFRIVTYRTKMIQSKRGEE